MILLNLGLRSNFDFGHCQHMQFSFDSDIELLELDKIKNRKLYLRLWRSGDNFSPLGMLGNQKVSDYLVNKKVNQFEKWNQVVLVAGEKILWLC